MKLPSVTPYTYGPSTTLYASVYLDSQVAGNNRPLYPKVDHYWFKVAHDHEPLALQVLCNPCTAPLNYQGPHESSLLQGSQYWFKVAHDHEPLALQVLCNPCTAPLNYQGPHESSLLQGSQFQSYHSQYQNCFYTTKQYQTDFETSLISQNTTQLLHV